MWTLTDTVKATGKGVRTVFCGLVFVIAAIVLYVFSILTSPLDFICSVFSHLYEIVGIIAAFGVLYGIGWLLWKGFCLVCFGTP